MQEVTPERKWADSTTGKGGFMVITLTPIYPVVYISLNKRWITLPVVYSRPFASKAVFWAILNESEFAVDCPI